MRMGELLGLAENVYMNTWTPSVNSHMGRVSRAVLLAWVSTSCCMPLQLVVSQRRTLLLGGGGGGEGGGGSPGRVREGSEGIEWVGGWAFRKPSALCCDEWRTWA